METFQSTVIKKSACVKLYRVQQEDWDCRRRFSLRAASLFAATFFLCETVSSPHLQFFSVPSAVLTLRLFRPTGCAQNRSESSCTESSKRMCTAACTNTERKFTNHV